MANAKGILSPIVAFLLCLFLTISATAQDNRGIFVSSERLALVIGNSAYQTAPLRNPVNDAEDMSRVLSTLGFKVILQKNVDRRALEDSIRSFGRQLRNGGVGLFYFAGHGIQVEGRNYLIPINARIESESDIKYEAVDAGFVLGKMEDASNQLNIVILDACRNNPYSRNFRSREQGLARMDAPTGSLIAYSTAPGSIAADGEERNGIYTKHLIRHMQTPNLTVELLLKRVRIDVAAETKQRQIPWESSSLMGDFYFKLEKMPTSVESPPSISSAGPSNQPLEPLSKIDVSNKTTVKMPTSVESPPSISSTSPSNQPSESLSKVDVSNKTTVISKNTLAVLPINSSYRLANTMNDQQFVAAKTALIEKLGELFTKNQDFQAVYSYYESGRNPSYTKPSSGIIDENTTNKLWMKKSIFSSYIELNIDLAIEIGKKLNVDFVFTCDQKPASIKIFLIKVNTKKVYWKTYDYALESGYSEAPKGVYKFFDNYKNDQLK
jgi:hypothetical protein